MQPTSSSGSPSRHDLMPSRNLATIPSEVPRQNPSKQSIVQQLAASRSSRVDMEPESEGGQGALMQTLDVDGMVRTEVNLGIQQITTIDQQLRTAPQGFLSRADISEAQALRMTLLTASATIMGSFSKIMGWLSAYPPNSHYFPNDNFSVLDQIGKADSPLLSTSGTHDSDPPHSPRHRVPTPGSCSKQLVVNPTSPLISPCHTPHSGSGMSEDSANPPSPPIFSDADGDAAASGRARRPANEATTSADPEAAKQKSLSVKRKFMPKLNCKQSASDPGHEGPPDDGHTWRKYGQKDILGSRNPRSYYRCTHKIELGCPAIKYVQRCDEEPLVFDVTYRGSHTCQSIHQQFPAWPFSFPEQMAIALNRVQQLPPSDPTCLPAIVNYPNLVGNHVNSSATSSDNLGLGGNRHGFSQLASGGVPSTAGILDIPRFSLNPTASMELGVHQQDVSRFVPRDNIFSSPDLLNILLANPRPGQNDISFTLAEDDLPSELRRAKLQHDPMALVRSTSDDSVQVDQSAESRYAERWVAGLDVNYQIEEQIACRFNSTSSIITESGQSRPARPNNQTTSGERGGIASMKESDNSVETPASSLSMMPVFTIDGMDYELSFAGGQPFL